MGELSNTKAKREELAYAAGAVATENYAAQCQAEDKPLTMRELKAAIRKEVFATIGKPPKRARPTPEQREELKAVQPIGNAWIDLVSAIKTLATTSGDLQDIVARTPEPLRQKLLGEARTATARLAEWIEALDNEDVRPPA